MLDDCRVLDLSDERGLACGQLLADLGATVVHVEPPTGSSARADRALWSALTRNQQSVVLDLDDATDRARFIASSRAVDIIIDSGAFALEELGVGYRALATENPALVFVAISPFGSTGPKRDYEATDLIVQAAAGTVAVTGFADRAPLRAAGVTAWTHAGIAAAGAALIALRHARLIGSGTHIDISAQEATGLANAFSTLTGALGQHRSPRFAAPAGAPCADGFVANTVGAGPMAHFLKNQAAWLQSEGLLDEATANQLSGGAAAPEIMDAFGRAVSAAFAIRTKQELLDAAAMFGFVLAPILTGREIIDAAQFRARQLWWTDGDITMPGPFAQFSATPIRLRGVAPRLDDHETDVLAERAPRPAVVASEHAPLAGVKVLDFGWVMAGPYASRVLADYGATVIKVESGRRLDLLRMLPPYDPAGAFPDNSGSFASVSAGKRSIELDLSNPEALRVALDLVQWADVVCESFAPGAMKRLGLDYEALRQHKPDVIMVSSSVFGQTGPYAGMAGFGTQGSAMSGVMHATGYPDRAPMGPYGPFTDFLAPRYQVIATLAALHHHDRTGQGQYIDLSQAESGVLAMAATIAKSSVDGIGLDRLANTDPDMRPHGVFPSLGDDEWVAIAVRDERDWKALCATIGRADLARSAPTDGADDAMSAWTATRSSVEAECILQEAGVPAHHVLTGDSATDDPQVSVREFFVRTKCGDRDTLVASTGLHLASSPAEVGPVPRIGEDTVVVLRDLLGYSEDRVYELLASGAAKQLTAQE